MHRVLKYEEFIASVEYTMTNHNARDAEALKNNQAIMSKLKELSKTFSDKERELLTQLMKKLEEEKDEVLKKTISEK